MPDRLPARLAVLALALAAACAPARAASPADEGPVIPTPSEYSEDARRRYAEGLREARAMIEARRYDAAIARLDELAKERPREPQARFLRAVALADGGKTDAAVVALRELVADFPELPEAHNNLAVLYAGKGEFEIARDELALAIAARPDYAVAHENLGDVYVRLAAAQYERVAKLDPTNRTAPAKLKLARDIVRAPRVP